MNSSWLLLADSGPSLEPLNTFIFVKGFTQGPRKLVPPAPEQDLVYYINQNHSGGHQGAEQEVKRSHGTCWLISVNVTQT